MTRAPRARRELDLEQVRLDWEAACADIVRCDQGLDWADDPLWEEYWIRRRRAAEERRRAAWSLLRALGQVGP